MRVVREKILVFQIDDRVMRSRLRQGNPNPRFFCAPRQLRNSRYVRKLETARSSTRLRKPRNTPPNSGDHHDKSKRRNTTLARLHGKTFLQANPAWLLFRVHALELQLEYSPARPAVSGLLK